MKEKTKQEQIEDFIEECYEDRREKNIDDLRYDFEDDLIENGYDPAIVSETDDGREEYQRDSFCDKFFNKKSIYMTDEEMYNILKKIYKM